MTKTELKNLESPHVDEVTRELIKEGLAAGITGTRIRKGPRGCIRIDDQVDIEWHYHGCVVEWDQEYTYNHYRLRSGPRLIRGNYEKLDDALRAIDNHMGN